MKKSDKIFLSLLLTVSLTAVTGAEAAYASSPEFARTAEEWALLQDNRMDYSELEGLVQEYNPTVQQNQFDYRQFREDYGDKKEDVSQSYRDLAEELLNDIDYPDVSDADYATRMTAALSSEAQAKNLQATADKNEEDSETKRLTYEMAEKTLVRTAQNNMIAYHTGLLDISKYGRARDQTALLLSLAQAKKNAGTATDVDVLTAQQNDLTAEQNSQKAQSDLSETKQKLQIMLGWGADASPEIGDIPEPDLTRIDRMNPAADTEKALANNYTLKINLKKLQNANSQSQKDTLNSAIADNRSKIAAGLVTACQNAVNARTNYSALEAASQLKHIALQQTADKYSIGSASRIEYDQAQIASDLSDMALEEAKLTLFESMEAYDWNVNGLSDAS